MECGYPPEGSEQLLLSASVGPCNAHTREVLMQQERLLQSRFSFISLSFLLHLLCTANNLTQSLLFCPLKAHYLSPLVFPHHTADFLLGHFIMLFLNILQPIVPKELVCYNMKIWPHLTEVMGNKYLTRGCSDRASNSNLLLPPCWFVVLPGSARFLLPVVSSSQKSMEDFISMSLPSLLLQHQIYWYWPFAEIKRVDPWAARAKFKPIKQPFTNQQGQG